MKHLLLKKLTLLSEKERAARVIPFHPTSTVLKGRNSTGKSCIIKSIYQALGAAPTTIHHSWKEADVRIALDFKIDDASFTMLKVAGRYSLFDGQEKLIRSFDKVTTEMAPFFAELFDFRLMLRNKKGDGAHATPSCLFLPFYFDQDTSWGKPWTSFIDLGQFVDAKKEVIHYHTGLKPNEYYAAKIEIAECQRILDEALAARGALDALVAKLDRTLLSNAMIVNTVAFQEEISRLLKLCEKLNLEQQLLKEELAEIYSDKAVVTSQQHIAKHALAETSRDFEYAATQSGSVDCPTCGSKYESNFREKFGIALDEYGCTALIDQLNSEEATINARMAQNRARAQVIQNEQTELESLLGQKKSAISLQAVLRGEGQVDVRRALDEELRASDESLGSATAKVESAKKKAARFSDKKLIAAVKKEYRDYVASFLHEVRVQNVNADRYKQLESGIKETGSVLPRAMLAYYFGILHTVHAHSTSTFCPIIIDSPKQQDTDDVNWQSVLQFLKTFRPPQSQMVLGVVNDHGVQLGGTVIEFTDEQHGLNLSEYDQGVARIRPLLRKSIE